MDSMDFSSIERRHKGTMATGFGISGDEDCFSDLEESMNYDSIQADYIQKLRTQRQRMEKLEKCYYEKEQQLGKEVQRTNELLLQVEKMATFIPFKDKYEGLRQDYNGLLSKFNNQHLELQEVKEQLSHVIHESSNTINRLKGELKVWKENSNLSVNQLEEALFTKEEEIKKIKKQWKEKQNDLLDEIKGLKNYVGKLNQQMEEDAISFDREKDRLCSQIKHRETILCQMEKTLENNKRVNMDLKNDVLRYSQEVNAREKEHCASISKLKKEISILKKSCNQKDQRLQSSENSLKKAQINFCDLKQNFDNLKLDYKKTCELYENNQKKLRYESQSEISRLEAFVQELKSSIEELMEVKNHLLGENKRFLAILKKKEQSDRQRKQLLMTQFKEIDRIEKVIDRLQ